MGCVAAVRTTTPRFGGVGGSAGGGDVGGQGGSDTLDVWEPEGLVRFGECYRAREGDGLPVPILAVRFDGGFRPGKSAAGGVVIEVVEPGSREPGRRIPIHMRAQILDVADSFQAEARAFRMAMESLHQLVLSWSVQSTLG